MIIEELQSDEVWCLTFDFLEVDFEIQPEYVSPSAVISVPRERLLPLTADDHTMAASLQHTCTTGQATLLPLILIYLENLYQIQKLRISTCRHLYLQCPIYIRPLHSFQMAMRTLYSEN